MRNRTVRDFDERKQYSQEDRIKAMDTKELAEFLFMADQNEGAIPYCKEHGPCDSLYEKGEEIPKEMCIGCMMEWLRSNAAQKIN